jgi:hypothetical protein
VANTLASVSCGPRWRSSPTTACRASACRASPSTPSPPAPAPARPRSTDAGPRAGRCSSRLWTSWPHAFLPARHWPPPFRHACQHYGDPPQASARRARRGPLAGRDPLLSRPGPGSRPADCSSFLSTLHRPPATCGTVCDCTGRSRPGCAGLAPSTSTRRPSVACALTPIALQSICARPLPPLS